VRVNDNLHPESILTMQIVLTDKHYGEAGQRAAFYDRMLERISALPGVEGAMLASNIPYGFNERNSQYLVEGQPVVNASELRSAQIQAVSPNYLATVGIPLIRGRQFRDSDGLTAPKVAIVTENFAHRNWPGVDPIGHRIRLGEAASQDSWLTVIGT